MRTKKVRDKYHKKSPKPKDHSKLQSLLSKRCMCRRFQLSIPRFYRQPNKRNPIPHSHINQTYEIQYLTLIDFIGNHIHEMKNPIPHSNINKIGLNEILSAITFMKWRLGTKRLKKLTKKKKRSRKNIINRSGPVQISASSHTFVRHRHQQGHLKRSA